MKIINRQFCDDTAAILRADPVYIDGIKAAILESGLADILGLTVDQAKLDPYRPCPADWTAIQLGFFDNGEPEKKRNRPKIQRSKMRHSVNIKVWTRTDINFQSPAQIAWQANAYLWTAEQAAQIVRDLREEGYVGQETVDLMDEAIGNDDPEMRYSVPLLRIGTATRWMRGHLVVVRIEDEVPTAAVLNFPHVTVVTEEMDTHAPDGNVLWGKVIRQARLASTPILQTWATQTYF